MGGGRYDGLVEEMGGPPTPAVGWAAGIERLSMLLPQAPAASVGIAVIPVGDGAEATALSVLQMLRGAGCALRWHIAVTSNAAWNAPIVLVPEPRSFWATPRLPQGVANVKDLASGTQKEVPLSGLVAHFSLKFADKLDRITARAEELRAALGEVIGGEAYVRASKELAELEPIVAPRR